MNEDIYLKAPDGHEFSAYLSRPTGPILGGIVVAMEMYGVNNYLRGVCDRFSSEGYICIAPAFFDRHEKFLDLPYDEKGSKRGKELSRANNFDLTLEDAHTARDFIKTDAGKVAILGFCFGGTVSWLGSCRGDFDASVPYYGSNMCDYPDEPARCPTLCHVGDLDTAVPPDQVSMFQKKRPEVNWCVYNGARHGFDNWTRHERYHQEAADLARARTLEFLARELA